MENLEEKDGSSQLETEFSLFSSKRKEFASARPRPKKRQSLQFDYNPTKKKVPNVPAFGSRLDRFPEHIEPFQGFFEEPLEIENEKLVEPASRRTTIAFGSKQEKRQPFRIKRDGPGPAQYCTDRSSIKEIPVPKLNFYENVVKRSKAYKCKSPFVHQKQPGPGHYQTQQSASPRTYSNLFKTVLSTRRSKQNLPHPKEQKSHPRFIEKTYKCNHKPGPPQNQLKVLTKFVQKALQSVDKNYSGELEEIKKFRFEKTTNSFLDKKPNPYESFIPTSKTPSPDTYVIPGTLNPKTQAFIGPQKKWRKKRPKTKKLQYRTQ